MAIIISNPKNSFFDINNNELEDIIIKENYKKDNCLIQATNGVVYAGFILVEKLNVKTICNVTFYKSKVNQKYIPRLEFRKVDNNEDVKESRGKDIIIDFNTGDSARSFWKMVNFLNGFKDLVDFGDFHSKYQAVSFEGYLVEFTNKQNAERMKDITSLVEKSNLSNEEIKSVIFSQRKKTIYGFYCFLKNYPVKEKDPFSYYRESREISENGEEVIWHHFLKENSWILGLNVDIRFIRDLYSEQKVGYENSKGLGSPKVDFLGISYFTTLIELKTSSTKLFKTIKTSNSRSNTWDFSNEFIEAFSQTLAQRTALTTNKEIIDSENNILDNQINRILDPKAVLIIGNRNIEFPHNRIIENNIKSDCFERLRRENRNIDIITYDELFERAYHIVYTRTLPQNWFQIDANEFIKDNFN